MAGMIRISCDLDQTANTPFPCRVHVVGGLAGDTIDIRLWQTAGTNPMYQGVERATLDGAGNGAAHFEVVLSGPCTARLVADDLNSPVPLHADDIHITVHP